MITTSINYPAGLTLPLREGYDINHVSPLQRTDLQSGRARQRRKFTSVPSIVSLTWFFDKNAHCLLFELWFKESLNDGAQWFNCPLQTPMGIKPYVCRFTTMYKGPTLVAASMWRISAELEIYERPTLPAEDINYPEELIYADMFDRTMNQYWPK